MSAGWLLCQTCLALLESTGCTCARAYAMYLRSSCGGTGSSSAAVYTSSCSSRGARPPAPAFALLHAGTPLAARCSLSRCFAKCARSAWPACMHPAPLPF